MVSGSRRQGLTLIEIMVVIALIGVLGVGAGGLVSGQLGVLRTKTCADRIVGALRASQQLARTGQDGRYGVMLFPDQVRYEGAGRRIEAIGHSLLRARERDPLREVAVPPAGSTLGTLAPALLAEVESLPYECTLTREWRSGAEPARLPPTRIVFDGVGQVDATLTDEDNLRVENPVPADPEARAYTFDVGSASAGYVRIRIRSGGSIEASALNDPTGPPTTATGLPF